jgi:hypothetical protein
MVIDGGLAGSAKIRVSRWSDAFAAIRLRGVAVACTHALARFIYRCVAAGTERISLSAFRLIVVEQNTVGGTIQVLVLSVPQRPEKYRKRAHAEHQGRPNQPQNHIHARARKLLPMTSSEDDDIAAAASHGVTSPATANGTISRL